MGSKNELIGIMMKISLFDFFIWGAKPVRSMEKMAVSTTNVNSSTIN